MMNRKEAEELFDRYTAGTCSAAEKLLFETLYAEIAQSEKHLPMDRYHLDEVKEKIYARLPQAEPVKTTKLWPRMVTIAAAVAAIVFGIWFYKTELTASRKAPRNDVAYKNDIAPGKNTATLTLPNGSIIQLSDAKTGVVIGAMKDATQLTYNDGSLVRSSLRGGTTKQSHTNDVMLTATTPRGGTYQFTLPDGTQVWLNAASKISFPAQFSGTNRKILLSGEAYLEVAKNKAKPFIVESNGQEVTVLGTHFNINAYTDESNTKTTLLEGSVRVNDVILTPNQQATNTGTSIKVTTVDPTSAIAWKNGFFQFQDANVNEVLTQLSRWYDVDIVYEGPVPDKQFTGKIYRNLSAAEALRGLKYTGLNFTIDGKKIIVQHKN